MFSHVYQHTVEPFHHEARKERKVEGQLKAMPSEPAVSFWRGQS